MADINNTEPLAAPWYTSGVQVNAVIAAAAQIISVILRIVARYVDVPIGDEDVQLLAADVTQLAAIAFGVIAIIKRKNSAIQPLTLTAKGAEVKSNEIAAGATPQ
jgi:hypothetical protein